MNAFSITNGRVTRFTTQGQQGRDNITDSNRYVYGDQLIVSCNSGYHITDKPTTTTTWNATCLANGSWAPGKLSCSGKNTMKEPRDLSCYVYLHVLEIANEHNFVDQLLNGTLQDHYCIL